MTKQTYAARNPTGAPRGRGTEPEGTFRSTGLVSPAPRSRLRRYFPVFRNWIGLLLFVGSLMSCHPDTIWNIKIDQFSRNVHSGNFDFLKQIDFSKADLNEINRLGENAAYYMSFVFRKIDRPVIALRLLSVEWQTGSGIWQQEAAKELITYYIQTRQYKRAEELAKQAYSTFPTRGFYRLLIEAWYWQHKDENVLKGLQRIAAFKGLDGKPIQDHELALFRAVSSYRLDKPGWQGLFVKLFSEQPASDFHIRAFDYFQIEKGMKEQFTKAEWALMKGKYDIAKREYGPAIRALRPLIDKRNPLLLTPWDLHDVGQAYIGSSDPRDGAEVFRSFIDVLLAGGGSSRSLYAAYQSLGRLYRAAGFYSEAVTAFQRAIGYAPNNDEYDRTAWYIIDTQLQRSPVAAAPLAAKYAKLWHNPPYFDDVLGDMCTELIQERDWSLLLKLYHELDGHADNRIIVRYAYDVASAIESGYIRIAHGKKVARTLLEKVVNLDADRYYTFLASARLGKVPAVLRTDNGVPTAVVNSSENTDWENYVMGFMSYDLYAEAYQAARRKTNLLGDAFIRELVKQLHDHGKILESLRLMEGLVDRPSANLSKSDLKLFYPQPFNSLMDKIAKKEKLSLPIFYGLVREESFFDASIVSSAGAVGLTQLMPSTARDIAQRMGMKDPVITNPSDNLEIGADYLSSLISLFQDTGEALFAYNAGSTRVFQWKSLYPGLPDDLFLEAVPFNQTQGYVKKILVSAVAYGYLYYHMTPTQVVKEILPNF